MSCCLMSLWTNCVHQDFLCSGVASHCDLVARCHEEAEDDISVSKDIWDTSYSLQDYAS